MSVGADDLARTPRRDLLVHLTQLVLAPDTRVFAVIDGAFQVDLPARCRAAGLSHRPLYRHDGDPTIVLGGPWIINPYRDGFAMTDDTAPDWTTGAGDGNLTAEALASRMQAALEAGDPTGGGMLPVDDVTDRRAIIARLDAILRLVGDCPGLVFWVGTETLTEDLLYGHLRRLNKMLVPAGEDGADGRSDLSDAAAGADEIPLPAPDEQFELVIFRHADANALAQVIPALEPPQLSRLFGPCLQIVHAPDWEWAATRRIIDRPSALPQAPKGPLRLTPATIRKMEALRMAGSRRKVMTYLREVDPGGTGDLPDEFLYRQVLDYEASGDSIGLQSERAHMKWAYLMSITGGEAGNGDVARRAFRGSGKHPDDAIDDLIDDLEKAV
ncbi:hypothetical protein CX676_14805 [Paracoccus zhejiangensis]|uniref:DUF4123 domain-containing protein n=2 Tax=Paracoccus zhejiangensis TaxID=1077935 RepID=A0A2H5F145_9RHOB|nr:hypothetical protein CX676_14805 [Paracoccus zhejiangensis]